MKKSPYKAISEDELFTAISRRANSIPENVVRDVYYSLINTIREEFRQGREIVLGGLGKLFIYEQNLKHINFKTGMGEVRTIKKIQFSGDEGLKKYINEVEIKD